MRDPNFFIIGAPKCGTTALSEYLREHPQVFITDPKEPCYFSSDFPSRQKFKTQQEYDFLFRHASEAHRAVGEASVHYLRSRVAIPALRKQYPDARFIVMLRNPVDFLPSWHAQMLKSLTEDVEDFETAWRLVEQRRTGEGLPRRCNEPAMLDYEAAASFGEQAERLLNHVDRSHVLFIKYDDFAGNTRECYQSVLNFLGVEQDKRESFPKVNPRASLRSRTLARWMPRIARLRRRLGIHEDSFLRRVLHRAALAAGAMNLKEVARPKLSAELIQELRDRFRDDIRRLAELTQLDLSDWIDTSAPAPAQSLEGSRV